MTDKPVKPRARDLGLPFDGTPGKNNAITDIQNVEVGFSTLIKGEGEVIVGKGPVRTGVTAILPRGKRNYPDPVWAGHFNLNGNGEMTGTHWINDDHFDVIYNAVVQAVEEAVINAMLAAEPMTTVKPAGYTLEAIDHERLQAIMKQYNRLEEAIS